MACRKQKPRGELVRLTADFKTKTVGLNQPNKHRKQSLMGRSAYICKSQGCLESALKGTRLKAALEGRKSKNNQNHRFVSWPLEAQLIKDLLCMCTQRPQTCKNTVMKEGGE